MGLVLFGGLIGVISALTCLIVGDISFGAAVLIYWITGTIASVLHATLRATTPAIAR